jgi:putative transcriptional regulator
LNFEVIFRLIPLLAIALSANCQQLATGNLLVATEKSHDPDFARSVVVLIRYDSESAIGLMLNKATSVPISDVLPQAKGKSVMVYAGGPVASGVRALVRTNSAPFFSLVTDQAGLLKLLAGSARFRIYAGYTGWTARQLESEVARGLWRVAPANASMLWPHPEQLRGLTPPRPIR